MGSAEAVVAYETLYHKIHKQKLDADDDLLSDIGMPENLNSGRNDGSLHPRSKQGLRKTNSLSGSLVTFLSNTCC